mmetsp:Transcript_27319/g.40205  ORF Transcript_27319/g.40205 Transcript_27319/m.40205 type:complete len:87 (-) Transcript_27319:84-344(-)
MFSLAQAAPDKVESLGATAPLAAMSCRESSSESAAALRLKRGWADRDSLTTSRGKDTGAGADAGRAVTGTSPGAGGEETAGSASCC